MFTNNRIVTTLIPILVFSIAAIILYWFLCKCISKFTSWKNENTENFTNTVVEEESDTVPSSKELIKVAQESANSETIIISEESEEVTEESEISVAEPRKTALSDGYKPEEDDVSSGDMISITTVPLYTADTSATPEEILVKDEAVGSEMFNMAKSK